LFLIILCLVTTCKKMPKNLSVNKEIKKMFLYFFIDLERQSLLPTYPKKWDQNHVIHVKKPSNGLS